MKVEKEQPHFPFIGKMYLIVEIQNSEDLLKFFELLITLEIANLISRETNRYAQQFLEQKPSKGKKKFIFGNKYEIKILLTFLLFQGLHQNPDNYITFQQHTVCF